MMHSHIPAMLQREDFHARHSDMLAAARCGPLTTEQVALRRKMHEANDLWRLMTERLKDNPFMDALGIDMAKPGSDRTVIVTKLPKAVWRDINKLHLYRE